MKTAMIEYLLIISFLFLNYTSLKCQKKKLTLNSLLSYINKNKKIEETISSDNKKRHYFIPKNAVKRIAGCQ